MKFFWIIIFIFYNCNVLHSQGGHVPTKNYSVKSNFLSDNIYCIFTDSKGLLWFGTDVGVLQYDGSIFKLLTNKDGLPDNEIFNFCEDREGRVWFASFNGNIGYYHHGQLFNEYNTPSLLIPNHPSFIYSISCQRDSSILFLYYNSTLLSEYKDGHFNLIQSDVVLQPKEYFFSASKNDQNEYCVITNRRNLLITNKATKSFDFKYNFNSYSYNENVFLTQGDSLYVYDACHTSLLYVMNKSEIGFTYTFYLELDSKDLKLYVGTADGLVIIDLKNSKRKSKLFPGAKVSSITKDIEGNFWVGTLNQGAYFIPKNYENANYYKLDSVKKVINILIHNKIIFLLTEEKKLYQMDTCGNVSLFTNFAKNGNSLFTNNRYYFVKYKNSVLIGGNEHCSLDLEHKSSYYTWSTNPKLYFRDINYTDKFFYTHNNYSLEKSSYHENKLHQLHLTEQPVRIFPSDKQRIFDIALYRDKLWLSTSENFYVLIDNELKHFPLHNIKSFRKFNFYGSQFIGITHDYQLTIGHMVSDDSMNIEVIDHVNIWMDMNYIFGNKLLLRSDKGYYILDLNQNSQLLMPIENGLLPNTPKEITCDSPYVYFLSTESEVYKIHHNFIHSNSFAPKLIIRSAKVNEKLVDYSQEISVNESICDNFSVEFTGIGFNRKKINYQYSLDGINWVNLETPSLILAKPKSGHYKIRLRCKSDSSDYGQEVVLLLHIETPWYKSFGFIAIVSMLTLALCWYFIKKIIVRNDFIREQRHHEELKFQHAEFKALNALMNPHFIFNSLNNIQYLINSNDKVSANEYLNTFSQLIRQNMNNIQKELITLQQEINLVKNYLQIEKLRFNKALQFELRADPELDLDAILVPPLIIQPLVENAIKHGLFIGEQNDFFIWVIIMELKETIIVKVVNTSPNTPINNKMDGLNQSLENIQLRFKKLEAIHAKKIHLELFPNTVFDSRFCFEAKITID